MIAKRQLLDKATWIPTGVPNEYGQKAEGQAQQIDCMLSSKTTLVRTDKGDHIVAITTVLTDQPIAVGDKINRQLVTAVIKLKDGRSKVKGYEVYLG